MGKLLVCKVLRGLITNSKDKNVQFITLVTISDLFHRGSRDNTGGTALL